MKEFVKTFAINLLGCAGLLSLSSHAGARTEHHESIEMFTAADVVVRGSIVEIAPGPGGGGFLAEIQVAETLKGPKSDTITVALGEFPPKFARWRDRKTELLFSLLSQSEGRPLRLSSGLMAAVELDDNRQGIVTMDFGVLKTRDAILKATRDGCAAVPTGASRIRHRLEPPRSSEIGRRIPDAFGQIRIFVPADSRLEQRGRGWAESDSLEYRYLAPMALSPFPSEENIAILKRLLSDDLHVDSPDGRGGKTILYPVRRPAYLILKKWGVAVKEPVEQVHLDPPFLVQFGWAWASDRPLVRGNRD